MDIDHIKLRILSANLDTLKQKVVDPNPYVDLSLNHGTELEHDHHHQEPQTILQKIQLPHISRK